MSKGAEAFKTLLFYLGGLVGFVILTLWMTGSGHYEEEFYELPTATALARQVTPTATQVAQTPTPEPAEAEACEVTPGSMRYGYRANAPFTTTLADPELERRGERLVVGGTVYAADCRTPLPEVLIEVWQADPEGLYDRSDDFRLRGQMKTDGQGQYRFTTVRPGRYVAGTEPLPAHIHYRVSYRTEVTLFTQLFFEDDPFIHQFPFVVPSLVISLTERARQGAPFWEGQFDLVLPVQVPSPKFRRVDGF